MPRLNKQGRLAKVVQPVEIGPSQVSTGLLKWVQLVHGKV